MQTRSQVKTAASAWHRDANGKIRRFGSVKNSHRDCGAVTTLSNYLVLSYYGRLQCSIYCSICSGSHSTGSFVTLAKYRGAKEEGVFMRNKSRCISAMYRTVVLTPLLSIIKANIDYSVVTSAAKLRLPMYIVVDAQSCRQQHAWDALPTRYWSMSPESWIDRST